MISGNEKDIGNPDIASSLYYSLEKGNSQASPCISAKNYS
jgi:hypothetical protein